MAKKKASPAATRKKSAKLPKSTKAKPAKKKSSKAAAKQSRAPVLGRPKVTAEEMLYMLFKEDYHARQIFDFLRVETVKELEQYSPQQIVRRLSKPITDTVDRIRRKLAEKNRFLSEDVDFAVEFQQVKRD